MQSVSSYNINQHCYCRNWVLYASLNKITKDSKIEEPKLKANEPKALNISLRLNENENVKNFNKGWKEMKKH